MDIDSKIREGEPLARFTTYQIGGPADFFVEATSSAEVMEALEWAEERDVPVYVFGGGSNLLFDDEGFRGLVIRMRAQAIEVRGEEIWVEAGCLTAKLVKAAADHALTGIEEWNGLPGTVGGAVLGNAGCFGVETKDVLKEAQVYLPGQGVKTLGVEEFGYSYRWSRFKQENGVILNATFRLRSGNESAIEEKMKAVARTRIQKQPPGLNTGSFFKNPPGDHAGRLIEASGLKGFQIGKAQISNAHANFMMNMGGASSEDVLALAEQVQTAVFEKFGVHLEREVVYVSPVLEYNEGEFNSTL